ncbi:VanW like family protein (fragment) [Candidatus Desulfosporosinus infrequens]|uniref:VanW like family protein n=1 Tax=Candidatus Desulfosporosinus infrequens TaxID=2043169 RepID=A0A2U3LY01_9FIRM
MQKTGLLMTALLLQFFVTLGLGSVVAYYNTYDRAPSGLIVWGQDFSGLNRIQVFSQLKKKLPNDVSFKEQVYPLKLNRSYADIEKWLDQLFPVTKDFRFSDLLTDIKRPFIIISPSTLEVNKEEVIAQLQLLSRQINKPMRSATMVYSDGSLETTAGEAGQELDIEGTWLKIAHEHEQKQIALVVNSIPPQPNAADMSKIRDILGDYTTYFNSQDLPRTKNLRLAAIALDNRLIPPDQVFSFNDVVGERTEAAGYLPAFYQGGWGGDMSRFQYTFTSCPPS